MREALPNLGPNTKTMLRRVGITSARQLRELGAPRAFVRIRQFKANASSASFTVLCELEGALTSRSWQEVAECDRPRLLSEVERLERRERFKDRASRAIFGAIVGAAIGFIAWTLEASPLWWVGVPIVALLASVTSPPSDWEDSDPYDGLTD